MSDFKRPLGFQDCWDAPRENTREKSVSGGSAGATSKASASARDKGTEPRAGRKPSGQGDRATDIAPADKARLARVVKGAPEVMVKVTRPAKNDKNGDPIHVSRATEALRVSEHLAYISRNGKLELENDRGDSFNGRAEIGSVYREWMDAHDEDRSNGMASERTRITTGIVFSMPAAVNGQAVKDAVRAVAEQEFRGRHHYVMALHSDTDHPHVHLTVRTVGHDGTKLNLRKADLQHLRDTFAQKLRQRGIEVESTPRHARGVTRKGEATPVYKIRQRGGKPLVDARKKREVQRDLDGNGGQLPQQPWDDALVSRRNRVMATYEEAARILESSDDPSDRELGAATKEFAARMTDVTTQRAEMAKGMESRVVKQLDNAEKGRPREGHERQGSMERQRSKRHERDRS